MRNIYLKGFAVALFTLAAAQISFSQTTPCASTYVLISTDPASCPGSPTGNCTGSNAANLFRAKIRLYFTTAISIGTSTPVITSALSGTTNLFSDYQFCISGDQGSAVLRSYADYCVYGKNNSGPFPTGTLTLTLQSTGQIQSPVCTVLNNLPCPNSVICLGDQTNCSPCDGAFTFFSGKIRVFFPSAIPAGVANPVITAVANAGVTLNQFKLCAATNAATNVERSFIDYCVYSNQAGQILPTSALSLTLQLGSLTPITCTVALSTVPCPNAFAILSNTTSCPTCDPNYPYVAGKIRLFFPSTIGSGIPNPVINSVANGAVVLNQFKLCASTTAGTNINRSYVDYCVYSNVPNSVIPTVPLTFTMQLSDCSAPLTCVTPIVSELPCITSTVAINTTSGPGGAGGIEAGCVNQSTCSGLIVYFASKLRVNFSPCLPAGFPAPTIASYTRTLADGTVIRYCLDLSASSAAQIGQQRCYIDYCVYSTLSGDTFLGTNPPSNLNATFTVMINGNATPLTQGACQPQGSPLPVLYASFTAERNLDKVMLMWETVTEINNLGFNVQRNSGNGWETIAFVPSAATDGNSSSPLSYNYLDQNMNKAVTQYRIQQVDRDGRSTYTEVRLVKGIGSDAMVVFENPSRDGTVNILFNALAIRDVEFLDMSGRMVRRINDMRSNFITVTGLRPGVYIIRVIDKTTNISEFKKVIVEN